MFIKRNRRIKNGREFVYYNIVENQRCAGGKIVQRQVLYLGELNSSQLKEWEKTIAVVDETDSEIKQLSLFDKNRLPDAPAENHVGICLDGLELHSPRQWGACWIALYHWDVLKLDEYFKSRLPKSRKGTNWLSVLKLLVAYRLIDPGSEWRLHRDWFAKSAMGDLLGEDFSIVQKDKLYHCHDFLLEHKNDLFSFLKERWSDLFGAKFEVLLYDLTSTYFESEPREPARASDVEKDTDADTSSQSTKKHTSGEEKRKHGYSRDKRPDCVQVVIALIVTPDGFPLGYEILAGNTADNTTLNSFLDKIEKQYGKADRIWVMDRGIPTEEVLAEMRHSDPPVRYLVGTPKGRLTKLEKDFVDKPWREVKPEVDVKLLKMDSSGRDCEGDNAESSKKNELYILARSKKRVNKERSMRRRRLKKLLRTLEEIQSMKRLTHDECLMKLGAARKEAGRAWNLITVTPASRDKDAREFTYELNKEKLRKVTKREGRYLLRSNISSEEAEPEELWKWYIQLIEVEEAFKNLKGDLAIRPIYHQKIERIEAHIFISFIAYCLHVTMRQRLAALAGGLTPRELLMKLSEIQMVDVVLPTTDGRILMMSRYTQPSKDVKLLLKQLDLELPSQPPPKIMAGGVVKTEG